MKLTENLAAKVLSIFLITVTVFSTVLGAIGIFLSSEMGLYNSDNPSFYDSFSIKNITMDKIYEVSNNYYRIYSQSNGQDEYYRERINGYVNTYNTQNSNFFFNIVDKDGKILLSNYVEQEYGYECSYDISNNGLEYYTVQAFVKEPLEANDEYMKAFRLFDFLLPNRYNVIILAAVSLLFSLFLFAFLLCSAGHRKGLEKPVPNIADKIPFDLYTALLTFIAFLVVVAYNNLSYSVSALIIAAPMSVLVFWAVLAFFMSLAARVKTGTLWKNTLIYKLFKLLGKGGAKLCSAVKYIYGNIQFVWKTVLMISVISLFEFVIIYSSGYYMNGFAMFVWFILRAVIASAIILAAIQLNKLKEGGKKIADGNLNYKINTNHMFKDFREHGENLNGIGVGMSKAVDQKMKSEMFKTELITNVSHDIKTPLTSIINYVDLLKKEGYAEGSAKDYIEVIDRQSLRLKKLTEDIVELSKVSTGNIQVNSEPTNVGELLTQAVGEYDERLLQNDLEALISTPVEDAMIMADGRLLWRVFDNILNNICKYSMPGTRVYFTITQGENKVLIACKNISKFPLNISGDELMGRFVRGDVSRNTEGSGLGLSIAESLTELQKGRLRIAIDGDLFKIELLFDRMK